MKTCVMCLSEYDTDESDAHDYNSFCSIECEEDYGDSVPEDKVKIKKKSNKSNNSIKEKPNAKKGRKPASGVSSEVVSIDKNPTTTMIFDSQVEGYHSPKVTCN